MSEIKHRCTWKDGRGCWGVRGVDLASLPPAAYGALCKLRDIECLADEIRQAKDSETAELPMRELLDLLGLHGEVHP